MSSRDSGLDRNSTRSGARKRNLHLAVNVELPNQNESWARPVEVIVFFQRVEARLAVEGSRPSVGLIGERWLDGVNRQ
jgi:hypothetical protein